MKKRIKDAIEILDDRLAEMESVLECGIGDDEIAEPLVMENSPSDLIHMIGVVQKCIMDMRDEMEFLFMKMGGEDFVEDYNDNESSLCDRCNKRLSRKERTR